MIKVDLTNEEMNILINLLENGISEIRTEIRQTDNRNYRLMLQGRETLMKQLQASLLANSAERLMAELA